MHKYKIQAVLVIGIHFRRQEVLSVARFKTPGIQELVVLSLMYVLQTRVSRNVYRTVVNGTLLPANVKQQRFHRQTIVLNIHYYKTRFMLKQVIKFILLSLQI